MAACDPSEQAADRSESECQQNDKGRMHLSNFEKPITGRNQKDCLDAAGSAIRSYKELYRHCPEKDGDHGPHQFRDILTFGESLYFIKVTISPIINTREGATDANKAIADPRMPPST